MWLRSTAWLLDAILLMSGCGGDSGNSADGGSQSAPPMSVPPSTTTSTPANTTNTATATGSQVFNPGTGSKWGLTATDWLEAWGTFEFIIDNLEPGEYRMLIGEPDMRDEVTTSVEIDLIGVTIPLLSAP